MKVILRMDLKYYILPNIQLEFEMLHTYPCNETFSIYCVEILQALVGYKHRWIVILRL